MKRRAAKKNVRHTVVKNTFSWQPFSGVILLIVCLALGYKTYVDKNKALQDNIDSKQLQLGKLKELRMREESRWNAMKTSANLEKSMARHGIDMNLPKSRQIIQMDMRGNPLQDQYSVDWFSKNRIESGNVVNSVIGR